MNALKRLLAPRKQVKKKSPRSKKERSELELLDSYRRALARHGADAVSLDLDNEFYWMFRLSALIALAYQKFDEINQRHFVNRFARPKIIFCNRSTGGYYNKTHHTIGISLAMTVEHGEVEFFETLLHEIAHIVEHSHSPQFYEVLKKIGGSGRKAPMTILLRAKRERFLAEHYSVRVRCPHCNKEYRYRTRRALRYACRPCCMKYANGKYDTRFRFIEAPHAIPESEVTT
jgi:predicted SprT family Zn-dependent metalloprotease